MIPFPSAYRCYAALRWLKQNADGDCSILVAAPIGILRVQHTQSQPLWYFVQKEAA